MDYNSRQHSLGAYIKEDMRSLVTYLSDETNASYVISRISLMGHLGMMGSGVSDEHQSVFRAAASLLFILSQVSLFSHYHLKKKLDQWEKESHEIEENPQTARKRQKFLRTKKGKYWKYFVENPYTLWSRLGLGGSSCLLISAAQKKCLGDATMASAGFLGNLVMQFAKTTDVDLGKVQAREKTLAKIFRKMRSVPSIEKTHAFLQEHAFQVTACIFEAGTLYTFIDAMQRGDRKMMAACCVYTVSNALFFNIKKKVGGERQMPSCEKYQPSLDVIPADIKQSRF